MKAFSFKEPWVNSYVERLLGLSASTKRAIIKILERSLDLKPNDKKSDKPETALSEEFWSACGAWDSAETWEELAASIRNDRTESPDREAL